MEYFYQGLILGLSLSVLIGPLFVAQTQATLNSGLRAGVLVNAGIWLSDIIVSVSCFVFIKEIRDVVDNPSFKAYVGIAGVIILLIIGIGLILRKEEKLKTIKKYSTKNVLGYMSKGFLVNTVNPFTFGFWITVSTTNLITANASNKQATILIGTTLAVIMITDTLKVVFAKVLKKYMTASTIKKLSQISGAVMVVLAMLLLWRVIR
jgi:threonine/homoserine/homoserine lactone efflux protein